LKYPCLVRPRDCKTPIKITIHKEGLTEDGSPIVACGIETLCNYQDSAKTVFTADKKLVQLSGVALLTGDICEELPIISGGIATIFGVERAVFKGVKARNPDGSVNYTELRLR
jgi:hypothetical protein